MSEAPRYKIVMLGQSGVGKTALVSRVSDDIFAECHVPTVGAQFIALSMTLRDKSCTLELWDTAGQEVFRSLVGFYAREARGAFILFDLTDSMTFSALPQWVEFLRENAPLARVIVFGNKSDLKEQRMVSAEEVNDYMTKNELMYFEGSAKTAENVRDSFEKMVEAVMEADDQQNATQNQRIGIDNGGKKQKKGCC